MVRLHLAAHCYSGANRCVDPLQESPGETAAPDRNPNACQGCRRPFVGAGKGKKCGRALSSPEATPSPSQKRKYNEVPHPSSDTMAWIITHHGKPVRDTSTGHLTHVSCQKCRVHLCLNKDRNVHTYHHAK